MTLLSCVIPNYNHGHFLRTRLSFLLSQLPESSELIIVDDASTDNSREIISEITGSDPRCLLIEHTHNLGVEEALNTGLRQASGMYFLPISADDVTSPEFFVTYLSAIQQYPEASCFFSDDGFEKNGARKSSQALKNMPNIKLLSPAETLQKIRNQQLYIPGHTVLLRTTSVRQHGPYIKSLGSFSDAFVNYNIALQEPSVYIPGVFVTWRYFDTSYSSVISRHQAQQREIALSIFRQLEHCTTRSLFRLSGLLDPYVKKILPQLIFSRKNYDFGYSYLWRRILRS